jgi:hypothetical protein
MAKNVATQLTAVGPEQIFDKQPELPSSDSVVHCQVAVEFATGGIGDAIVSVYGVTDGTDADFDTQALDGLQFILKRQASPSRISFTVSGVSKFQVGVQSSGTLGELAKADFSFKVGTPTPPPAQ